ncbi:HEAT repeat domain-containing protein [candidate division KSB1 bacterium]|nr:HEAT repeat domain-containing protein [candidate division KSB1 bacterium]
MKTAWNKTIILLILIGVCAWAGNQEVIQISDHTQFLKARWNEAFQEKKSLDQSCWIGYSIEVETESNVHFRHGHGNYPTLEEILTGQTSAKEMSVQDAAKTALNHQDNKPPQKIRKNMGILLKFDKNGDRAQDCREINIMDFNSQCDLKNHSLIWMGQVEQSESLPFLTDLYKKVDNTENKEDLVAAIAFHQKEEATIPFLKKVVKSKEDDDVRESAVFWLSQQDGDVLDFLVDVAHTDRSEDIREHAVFAISQVDGKEAEEALIRLAKKDKDPEVRKKAVFWLGQKASEKATRFLKDVVDDDPDTDVKEHAVFALSQMDTEESLEVLMKIAKTHPNREVRKKAIFWLGQSDQPEAVDFLISLVRNL